MRRTSKSCSTATRQGVEKKKQDGSPCLIAAGENIVGLKASWAAKERKE
jgi:hypothetical protein